VCGECGGNSEAIHYPLSTNLNYLPTGAPTGAGDGDATGEPAAVGDGDTAGDGEVMGDPAVVLTSNL
jgi:hypothetical protein